MAETPDWLRLQRKIFSRWVGQKVAKRHIKVEDVVKDMSTGILLINLIEELADKPFTDKYDKAPKIRAQLLDNANLALKFAFANGVQMKIKPQAEDLVDGDEKNILGLVWAIMLKFIKIGDDDEGEQLNAKDALLMWVKNKVSGYAGINASSLEFKKGFSDGLAFCALIHKHRPKLVNYDTLVASDAITNLKIAIDAAEKYFGLEKYLEPEDIPKLDENSMVIYVSDYYYGIAEQRKLDLAAKRIGKLVKFTEENDARRAEYKDIAGKLKAHIETVKGPLEDTTIHNTLAGAQKRLDEFYAYKGKDKNEIIADQLNLEAIFNNLAIRLKSHKRPDFVPVEGQSLKDFDADIKHLEERENFQNVALHAELNRQIKLVKLNELHTSIFGKLKSWIAQKEAYLRTKEVINSVSAAQLNLKLLDAYDAESKAVHETSIAELKKLGAELIAEKYEHSDQVTARETEVNTASTTLAELSAAKRPVLDDHLAREIFKEKVRLQNLQHTDKHKQLEAWIAEKEAYLNKRETIASISEAQTQLGLLAAYEKEKSDITETNVASHKSLGEDILAQKYETQYSSYVWEKPDEIKARISFVESKWAVLSDLSAEKKRVLDDHLAREIFKENVRQMDHTHSDNHSRLLAWIADKEAYLNKKEEIDSVSEAQTQLSLLEVYESDKKVVTSTSVAKHHALGKDILAQKYETSYSSYVWEKPDEINARISAIDQKWELLSQLSAAKKQVLDADLARELEKERLRLEFAHLASEFTRWTKDTAEKAEISQFGFNLAEVEAYQAVLDKSNADIQAEVDKSKAAFTATDAKLKELAVTQNVYTTLTLDDLAKSEAALTAALEARNSAFKAELERQRANDALCKEFAAVADPLAKWIIDQKAAITTSAKDVEEQLKFVDERISSQDADTANLEKVKELYEQIKAKGITQNIHTNLTAQDVEVQTAQYKLFLEKKRVILNEEVENKKLRGISAEDYKEIEENFTQFDFDKSNNIDKKELKACLYSLGEEKTKSEIEAIVKEYGNDAGKVSRERFVDFMVVVYGDTESQEQISNGFKLINRGAEIGKTELMELVMAEYDVEYVKKTAPQKDGGYDYVAWTADVFSR